MGGGRRPSGRRHTLRCVLPHVEIENQPADLLAGHDAQLEAAVAMMVKALQGKPASLPAPPPLLPL